MERDDIERVLRKLDIKEEDVVSMSETHSFTGRFDPSKDNVRSKFKIYIVKTKDGAEHTLKMNYLNKQIRKKGEIGFDLMVE